MRRLARFYGPLVELSRLQSELNRLFSLFVESNKSVTSGSSWDPNVDILDDGEKLVLTVNLHHGQNIARGKLQHFAGLIENLGRLAVIPRDHVPL